MIIGLTQSGRIATITDDGGLKVVSCDCCISHQMVIKYDWSGTGKKDLDAATAAFGELVGWSCGDSGQYVQWIGGDNTGTDGMEQVDIRVDDARKDGLWTSSYNIICKAGWYTGANPVGSGPANLIVVYKGKTKTKQISPGAQDDCATNQVATITVYSSKQPDGTYFEIV